MAPGHLPLRAVQQHGVFYLFSSRFVSSSIRSARGDCHLRLACGNQTYDNHDSSGKLSACNEVWATYSYCRGLVRSPVSG